MGKPFVEPSAREPLCIVRDIYRLVSDFEGTLQAGCGVGLNEGMLLCSLSKAGQSTSGQIAEALGLTSSNASKVIASAERKGLIGRMVGKEDRRRMLFALTPAGEKCVEKLNCKPETLMAVIRKIKEI